MIAGLVAISFGVLGLWKRDWLVRAIEFVGSVYSHISARTFPVRVARIVFVVWCFLWGAVAILGSLGVYS
jgi:hypothetical protein